MKLVQNNTTLIYYNRYSILQPRNAYYCLQLQHIICYSLLICFTASDKDSHFTRIKHTNYYNKRSRCSRNRREYALRQSCGSQGLRRMSLLYPLYLGHIQVHNQLICQHLFTMNIKQRTRISISSVVQNVSLQLWEIVKSCGYLVYLHMANTNQYEFVQ